MLDLLKKTMITGIGLALVAKDEVEDLAVELGKKLNLSETEGDLFVKDLRDRYDGAQKKLEEKIESVVKEMLKKADIVTGDELKGLKKEIRELKKAVSESSNKDSSV